MRNKTISYLWNANSIKITDEISTGITCSRVQFKFQCCKSVWASWCHSKERFIDRIIMLWLIHIKVTSSLLLPSHFFEELKFSVEVQLLVVLIQSFLLLSCEESSSVSPWSHYRFSCSSISGRWWWTIFSAIVSPHPFSHSHPGSLLLSLKGLFLQTCALFCSLPLRKYSHPYDAGMAAGLRSWFGKSHCCS